MKRKILLFIVLFLSISCKHNSTVESAKMDVDLNFSGIKTIPVDTTGCITFSIKEAGRCDMNILADNVEYIPLETSNNILVGEIKKLIFHNDRFYILDTSEAQSVFIFGSDGKYINAISSLGRGPNEYLTLTNMTLDKFNNKLILLDDRLHDLLYYDLDGNFLKKEKIGIRIHDLARINNEDFVLLSGHAWNIQLSDNDNFGITIGDPSGILKWRAFEMDKFYKSQNIMGENLLFQNETGVFYSAPFTNEVYHLSPEGKISLKYRFLLPNGSPQLYRSINKTGIEFLKEISTKSIWYNDGSNFMETNKFVFASITIGSSNVAYFVYDKISKDYFVYYTNNGWGTGRVMGLLKPMTTDGDNLFSVLQAYSVTSGKKANEEGRTPEGWELPEILKGVKEDDNPIIIKYNIKTPILDSYINEKVLR